MTALRKLAVAVLAAITLSLVAIAPAAAYAPVDIVHTERVQVGPYVMTVGFSTWPIRAMKSLDFTFMPEGGIADKTGTLRMSGPAYHSWKRGAPFVRHPRKRESWGLDILAIDDPGDYSLIFTLDGPLGHGEGSLDGVHVLDQPGPPLPLSWTIASLPLLGLIAFLAVAWRRLRPGRRPLPL
ncbi:hypothetical protein DFR70_109150 [Nocardia tenerifensis]|uniref:Uncharacterized protein n=1 Tax=Nocardia tenerifensis TaxID=228006 RepID=A0A318JWI4_9NOCA|nr:hypothetical protein [Nocardia tenerifensis]PXX60959.1 hypothetical protein DFR70_109150 [Nocardia tenerifensis]